MRQRSGQSSLGSALQVRADVGVVLVKRTAAAMDPFAVLEGCKPILDGLVLAGTLPGDDGRYVLGGYGMARKSPDGWQGVLVTISSR